MKFNLFVVLPFVAQALSAGPPRAIPPKATLLFSATLIGGVPAVLPSTPFGERLIVSINNGTVSGPKLNGQIIFGQVSSTTYSGAQRAEATFVVKTREGENVIINEKAVISSAGPPYVEATLEANNGRYGFLNNLTVWADGTEANGVTTLNYWSLTSS